jgi:hypothetical protein
MAWLMSECAGGGTVTPALLPPGRAGLSPGSALVPWCPGPSWLGAALRAWLLARSFSQGAVAALPCSIAGRGTGPLCVVASSLSFSLCRSHQMGDPHSRARLVVPASAMIMGSSERDTTSLHLPEHAALLPCAPPKHQLACCDMQATYLFRRRPMTSVSSISQSSRSSIALRCLTSQSPPPLFLSHARAVVAVWISASTA